MNTLFSKLGSMISKSPFKVVLISMVVFGVMIAGASQMQLATGNATLVQTTNPVYISNEKMENTFGGDSILVLLEAEQASDLLAIDNIKILYEIEKEMTYQDNVFSMMSPASMVHEITKRQSDELIKQIIKMSDGLKTMGTSMVDLSKQLLEIDMKDPAVMLKKLNELSGMTDKFEQLAAGQTQIAVNVGNLGGGLKETSTGLKQASDQLGALASQQSGPLAAQLTTISGKLRQTSEGLLTMGNNTSSIQQGSTNTSNALITIKDNLEKELTEIKGSFTNTISPKQFKEMAENFSVMGNQLVKLSEGLTTIQTKSNMMEPTIVSTQDELDFIFYDDNGKLKSLFSDVILNDKQAMMVVKLKGNLSDAEKDELTSVLQTRLNAADFKGLTTTVSGKTVLDSALKTEMKSSMMIMVGLAIIIMLFVLALTFKVKWRMLSLLVVFISVLATLGFMGWVGVPITMVSMAVFPILIGLGIDYSIQFHNRFEEEQSVKKTVNHIGKAVAIAVFATVLGFISLYASPVPMIQDFGKMLTFGVIISFFGSVLLLLPILKIGKVVNYDVAMNYNIKVKPQRESILNKLLVSLTKFTIQFKFVIIALFVIAAGVGFLSDQYVGVETNIEKFMPQDLQALDDIHIIRDAVKSTDQIIIYLEDENMLSKENLQWISDTTQSLMNRYPNEIVGIKSIDSLISTMTSNEVETYEDKITAISNIPIKLQSNFVSKDHSEALMILNIEQLSTEDSKLLIENINQELENSNMKATLTGKTVLDVEMVAGLTEGRITMTLLGLGLVFAALLVIYRNVFKAIIPLIPVVVIIGISSGVMYALGINYTPITATLGALVLGMGTEMTIMVLERYVEERNQGLLKKEAIEKAVGQIGKAVMASGLTTVGGFSVLMFSKFVILQDFGLMTMINISLALISTFIVLPPVIVIFDRFIVSKVK